MISLIAAVVVAATALPTGGVLAGEQAAYDSMIAQQARAADAAFAGAPCDGAKIEIVAVTPWKIMDRPDLIVWREKVRVTGCGRTSIENVNVGRLGGSPPWRMTTGLPGDSLAEMNLQESAYGAAVTEAHEGLDAGCNGQLADVYIAARPGGIDIVPPGIQPPKKRSGRPQIVLPDDAKSSLDGLDLSNAWMEVWPFRVCDHDRTLGVVFMPKKDQTESLYLFVPIWQQIEAHGPGARPAPAPPIF